MEPKVSLVLALLCFALKGDVRGDSLSDSAPQFIRLINKPRTTWAEVHAQRLIGGQVYETCYKHVVQSRLSGENHWHINHNITEKGAGNFVITNLRPGHAYEVRIACKSDKIPATVGAFSDPVQIMTPLTNPKGASDHYNHNGEDEDPNTGGRSVCTMKPAVITATFILLSTLFS